MTPLSHQFKILILVILGQVMMNDASAQTVNHSAPVVEQSSPSAIESADPLKPFRRYYMKTLIEAGEKGDPKAARELAYKISIEISGPPFFPVDVNSIDPINLSSVSARRNGPIGFLASSCFAMIVRNQDISVKGAVARLRTQAPAIYHSVDAHLKRNQNRGCFAYAAANYTNRALFPVSELEPCGELRPGNPPLKGELRDNIIQMVRDSFCDSQVYGAGIRSVGSDRCQGYINLYGNQVDLDKFFVITNEPTCTVANKGRANCKAILTISVSGIVNLSDYINIIADYNNSQCKWSVSMIEQDAFAILPRQIRK